MQRSLESLTYRRTHEPTSFHRNATVAEKNVAADRARLYVYDGVLNVVQPRRRLFLCSDNDFQHGPHRTSGIWVTLHKPEPEYPPFGIAVPHYSCAALEMYYLNGMGMVYGRYVVTWLR